MTCGQYALNNFCKNGAFVAGKEWTGKEGNILSCSKNVPSTKYPTCAAYYNYPGQNCVVCGKCKSGRNIITFRLTGYNLYKFG